MAERNPYVILGVPFGASRDQATLAFTARARRLRRDPNGGAQLTELTWALNQVTDVIRSPELAIDIYRIPADPQAIEPLGSGVLSPPPQPMPRRTPASDEARRRVTDVAAGEGLAAAYRIISSMSVLPPR